MKLDKIQDIEILRNELKRVMAKCIKEFKQDELVFEKDEYYHYEQSLGDIIIYKKIFPKENESVVARLETKEDFSHFEFCRE